MLPPPVYSDEAVLVFRLTVDALAGFLWLRAWWRWVQERRVRARLEALRREVEELEHDIEVQKWFAGRKRQWEQEQGHDQGFYDRRVR